MTGRRPIARRAAEAAEHGQKAANAHRQGATGLRPALTITRVANTSTPTDTACLYSRPRVMQPARSAVLAMRRTAAASSMVFFPCSAPRRLRVGPYVTRERRE